MMRSPAELAQAQLEAYNAKDLDAFCACYGQNVQVFEPPAPLPTLQGLAALRARYAGAAFANPELQAEVLQRIVCGPTVVDHERVHVPGQPDRDLVVVYRCEDGHIASVFFYKSP
ncbi:nuclear transport factor 2 family protein [Mitsuaria sp. WAJ17]|uniref:nuclear transport factor 2 family protein n=1 Tax=Mitsuaria sp. WAJ17 TaxID=2761452 RepID=UPI001600B467|nr:nuclear transport factor 2 family protein [Mitsuaria sp. WAJ17]MBB2484547.1 nuclear transport factor 2 family protein [Mitsuaria sp. WAJ17]